MSTPVPDYPAPADVPVAAVKDNPKRPNKALTGAAIAFAGGFVTAWLKDKGAFTGDDFLTCLAAGLGVALPAFLGVYVMPNPKVRKAPHEVEKDRQKRIRKGQRGAARPETLILGAVLLIVALMLLFWVILPAARQ